jgi:hypothetical protein
MAPGGPQDGANGGEYDQGVRIGVERLVFQLWPHQRQVALLLGIQYVWTAGRQQQNRSVCADTGRGRARLQRGLCRVGRHEKLTPWRHEELTPPP